MVMLSKWTLLLAKYEKNWIEKNWAKQMKWLTWNNNDNKQQSMGNHDENKKADAQETTIGCDVLVEKSDKA